MNSTLKRNPDIDQDCDIDIYQDNLFYLLKTNCSTVYHLNPDRLKQVWKNMHQGIIVLLIILNHLIIMIRQIRC